eukprot:TRINITY_DN47929_c0_g1_i1.p1 TRINITY_DN47929_c0_g1~~TRINITY_DN47929_c0_g1_i1.p1  ORF type:complete len:465 (-),score=25.67 TRINITY_DN47929_c0_g1_i1:1356-2699(-)
MQELGGDEYPGDESCEVPLAGAAEEEPTPGTIPGTYFNILKNIVGSGILPLPYAIKLTGWMAVAFLLCVAALVYCSVYAIVHTMVTVSARDKTPLPRSYNAIAIAVGGHKNWGLVTDGILLLYTVGTLVSYHLLIYQFFSPIIDGFVEDENNHYLANVKAFWIWNGALIVFCLCLFRNLSALRYTSMLGISFILYLVVLIVINAGQIDNPAGLHQIPVLQHGVEIFQALGLMLFSLSFHYNVPRYYGELQNRSMKKMMSLVAGCYFTIICLFLTVILCGVYAYGAGLHSNIVQDLPTDFRTYPQYGILRLGLGVMIICTYPIIQFQTRSAVVTFACVASGKPRPFFEESLLWRVVMSGCILVVAACIGWAAPNVGVVLGYNGALAGALQLLVIPGSWIFFVHRQEHKYNPSLFGLHGWLGLVLMGCGLLGGALALVGTTVKILHTKK